MECFWTQNSLPKTCLSCHTLSNANWRAHYSNVTADEIWRRIGLDGSPADQRLPGAGTWGGYPGGVPVEKGAPLFPRRKS